MNTKPPSQKECSVMAGFTDRTARNHYKGDTYNAKVSSATAILCGKCANDNSKGIIQDIAENGLSDRLINAIADTHKATKSSTKDVLSLIALLVTDMDVDISNLWLYANEYEELFAVFIAEGILCKVSTNADGYREVKLSFDGKEYAEFNRVSPAYALKMHLIAQE